MPSLFRRKITRRRFLGLPLFVALVTGTRGALGQAFGLNRRASDPLQSLPAFIDTLLPADGNSPSASSLGVHRRVIEGVQSPGGKRFVAWGCAWLDDAARRRGATDFLSAPDVIREEIVAAAAAASKDRHEYIFFDAIRWDAFHHYYTDRRSWPALAYDGPPQPAGFPDHASPPGRFK